MYLRDGIATVLGGFFFKYNWQKCTIWQKIYTFGKNSPHWVNKSITSQVYLILCAWEHLYSTPLGSFNYMIQC